MSLSNRSSSSSSSSSLSSSSSRPLSTTTASGAKPIVVTPQTQNSFTLAESREIQRRQQEAGMPLSLKDKVSTGAREADDWISKKSYEGISRGMWILIIIGAILAAILLIGIVRWLF